MGEDKWVSDFKPEQLIIYKHTNITNFNSDAPPITHCYHATQSQKPCIYAGLRHVILCVFWNMEIPPRYHLRCIFLKTPPFIFRPSFSPLFTHSFKNTRPCIYCFLNGQRKLVKGSVMGFDHIPGVIMATESRHVSSGFGTFQIHHPVHFKGNFCFFSVYTHPTSSTLGFSGGWGGIVPA